MIEFSFFCRALPNLTKINFNDQPLEGHFPTLFNPIVSNLTKLSLVRCHLRPEDITCLAQSRHVYTLKYLKLDHNDLHMAAPQVRAMDSFVGNLCEELQRLVTRCNPPLQLLALTP